MPRLGASLVGSTEAILVDESTFFQVERFAEAATAR